MKVLVRHAQSTNNERAERTTASKDRVGGYQPEIELSLRGEAQARGFGHTVLARLSELLDQDIIVIRFSTAPAVRTRRTAALAHAAMGLCLPVDVYPQLHELRKGNKWLGGDEKRLRYLVETPAYHQRRAEQGWDFRSGRPILGRIGLGKLSGAETARESAERVVGWFEDTPPTAAGDLEGDVALVDMAFGHGISGRYGVAKLLHSDHEHSNNIEISVQDADRRYKMDNTSAFVLSRSESGLWVEEGRLAPPEL